MLIEFSALADYIFRPPHPKKKCFHVTLPALHQKVLLHIRLCKATYLYKVKKVYS